MKIKKILPILGAVIAITISLWWIKTGFVHPWFAIAWGIVSAIGSFFTEINSWWRGERTIKLSPKLQLLLLLFMIIVAVVTTNWVSLGVDDLIQWGFVVFTILPLYWHGFLWTWKNLIKKSV